MQQYTVQQKIAFFIGGLIFIGGAFGAWFISRKYPEMAYFRDVSSLFIFAVLFGTALIACKSASTMRAKVFWGTLSAVIFLAFCYLSR